MPSRLPAPAHLRLLFAAGLLLALGAGALPAAPAHAAAGEPLRVLPFGDSLTKGTGSTHGGGYRLTFLARMREAGVAVDMVGTKKNGPPGMDPDHSGIQGEGVAKLDEVVTDEVRKLRPDVVLLMIGTNDADLHFVPDAFRIRYSVILDRLLGDSHVRVLAATIPPSHAGRKQALRLAVNKIISEEVEKRAAAGVSVQLVDVFHVLDPKTDFVDRIHMNDAGYEKIGNAFADAFLAAPKPPPRTAAPSR